jgi:RNA polymerase sigma-70 factor, ECF subfamily
MPATPATQTADEQRLLAAARSGEEDAFAALIGPHRAELHAHCYRMLGSVHDAEDALQDALLRAWRGLSGFAGRSTLRAWLYRIATNASLDAIARRPKRVLPVDYGPAADPHTPPGEPLTESVWLEPYPDERLAPEAGPAGPEARYEQREAVELAFIAALQHLPARQRAVLILREVLGFSAAETSEALETTTASVNSALQRARRTIADRLPDQSQQQTLRSLGDRRVQALVEAYVDAWERGDVEMVVSMLAEDARVTMPPMPTWYAGRDAIRVFLSDWAFAKRWARDRARFEAGERRVRLVPVRANGQLAFGAYNWDEQSGRLVPYAFQVLTLDRDGIREITGFVTPAVFERFGLPDSL